MTSNNDIEIETRTIVSNTQKVITILGQAGFERKKTVTQTDIMYDLPAGDLFKSGQKIRVRIEGDEAILTYKGKSSGDETASRRLELNIPVAAEHKNSLGLFLDSIGYPMLFQIRKERQVYSNGTIEATMDQWPIIGTMLELEGREAEIKDIIDGFFPDFDFKNYRLKELFESKCKSEGKTLKQLQEIYEKDTGFKLGNLTFLVG